MILSDWAITSDCPEGCRNPQQPAPPAFAMPWGVEGLSSLDRVVKAVNAGIDQFGGITDTDLVVKAMSMHRVSEVPINQSVKRILETKFRTGFFEKPYVDTGQVSEMVARPADVAEGLRAQAESQVLVKDAGGLLPLVAGQTVYLVGIAPGKATGRGLVVVSDPAKADVAIARISTPFEVLHPVYFFGSRQHDGRLDLQDGDPEYERLKVVRTKTKVIAPIFLNRPDILTYIIDLTDVILCNFGISDDALLDRLVGRVKPMGRIPFELPSSIAAVQRQDPALPDDRERPLFKSGAGILPGAANSSASTPSH